MKNMKKLAVLVAILGLMSIIAGAQAIAGDERGLSPSDALDWRDLGIVYGAGAEKAYYPSVLYDPHGFGDGRGPKYKMWYSDGNGTVKVVTSQRDRSWSSPTTVTGLGDDAHHVQVLYDANGFGGSSVKYKIWYWDIQELYSINAIAYAESSDGVNWTNDQAITQGNPQLVTGSWPDWNNGSYGPIYVIYQPGALNTGDNPWNYSYVMFYDGTNGSNEETGLAYSANGKHWIAYVGNPVLRRGLLSGAWDYDDAAYGTVFRDATGFHFWYSGGGPNPGDSVDKGIGYAFSLDGLTWTKAPTPIFHITDAEASHRDSRTYTPSVVDDGRGQLKMYYSARNAAGDYAIGLAVLEDHGEGDDD
jgi:hypothetical protein